MRTLFINRIQAPQQGATGRVLEEMISELKNLGETTEVLSCKGNRVFTLIKLFLKSIFIKSNYYDCVVIMTDPPFLLLLAPIFKLKKTKVVYWCQDVYPDLFDITGHRLLNNPLTQKIKDEMLKYTDHIVAIGRDMKKPFMTSDHIPRNKIFTIYNWADKEIKPINVKKEKFTIMYSGNNGKAYDLESIIETAKILEEEQNILFKIVLPNKDDKKLLAKLKDLNNVQILDFLEVLDYNKSINSANLCFVPVKKENLGLMVPCKAYSSLAAGVPLIYLGHENSELSLLINEYKCGIKCNNTTEVANSILTLYKDKKLMKELSNNALKINKEYGLKQAAIKMQEVINNV